jgi:hypothetical protein
MDNFTFLPYHIRFPFSLICGLQNKILNGSGAHPTTYPMGTRGSFAGRKAAGHEADHSPPSSTKITE